MDQTQWYYVSNEQRFGPVPQSQLEQLLASQQLPMNTLVWTDSIVGDWVPADKIPAFARLSAGVPAMAAANTPVPQPSRQPSMAPTPPSEQTPNPVHGQDAANQLHDLIQQPKAASSSARSSALVKSDIFYSCYLKNAYRVLGIPGASSQQELKKTIASIRRQAKVGKAYASPIDLPWLGVPIGRTERDLHDAETKLLNPETRIRERLLWFHSPPEELAADLSPDDAARQAQRWAQIKDPIAMHDAAVLMQFAAMAKSPQFEETEYWAQAISLWKAVLAEESYWLFLCEIDQQQGFEPACLSTDIFAHKDKFMDLVTEPIVLISKDALNRGNQALFAVATSLINSNANAGGATGAPGAGSGSAAPSEITDEFHRMMNSLCEEIAGKMTEKVDRNEKTYKKHRQQTIDVCGQCETIFQYEIEPILQNAKSVLPDSDPNMIELRSTAAATLELLGNGYTWADDYVNAIRVLEKAMKLAQGTAAEPKILDSLDNAQKNLEMQKVFGEQKRCNMAPLLFTMNTVGFTIYPAMHEEPEPYLGSKRAIYYFVVAFLPIFPLASYRVIFNGNGTYNFISSIPLDKFARIHQAVIVLPLLFFMIHAATYKPSPEELARQAADNAARTEAVIQRVTKQKQIVLPDGKYDLKDMVSEDDKALDDLGSRLDQVKPIIEKQEAQLTAELAAVEKIEKVEKPASKEKRSAKLKALIDKYNEHVDAHNKVMEDAKGTVDIAKKISEEREAAATKYNDTYATRR
jgi:hypothetical protein